ncbi:S41 family peptidase [Candidatus Parcubacteria bacterium]|nr:S41 family peptidase [Candidatus Parcubacteria bacterium]
MFLKNSKFRINHNGKDNFFVRNLGVLLSVVVLLVVFSSGVYAGKFLFLYKNKQFELKQLVDKDAQPDFVVADTVDFKMFWDVWGKIKKEYVHAPIDEMTMFYGAMQGMAASLGDPYTLFFPPTVAEEFKQDLAGEFNGIGAEVGIKDEQLIVVAPLADSPAEKAGLLPGDKILAIDSKDTKGIALEYAVKQIRGKDGTSVKLLISRKNLETAKEIEVVRSKIVIKSVQWRMENDLAYVQILQFGNDTKKEFDDAVKKIILKNPEGIIIDLRNNPGGFLDAAVAMAGEWVPDKPVVYERYSGQDTGLTAYGKGRLKDFKTVILINKGSALASEIVSGALKDYNKAILVGEKTFGKGSVQDYTEYKDGSALKMTIALWLTPNGTSIDGEGIEPNYVVEYTEDDYKNGEDPQLSKAKELLKNY